MSLNFDRLGRFLCRIEGGKYDKKIISVTSELKTDNEDEYSRPFKRLTIPDGKLQQIPDPDTERSILYITGASGSGKSTYTANYIKCYKRMFPKNQVYCFSALKEDESLDVVKPKRIAIDDRLVSEPIPIEEFKDSCVIFDDIDVISDKKQREAVYAILNSALETGRHHRVTVIITNHLATAGKDTRRVLNEAHSVTYFPFSGSNVGLKRLLVDYLGLTPKMMAHIKTLKSRWATIVKNYPGVLFTEKDIWLQHDDDEPTPGAAAADATDP
jgi:predicted AAA+ superfamily ATPase